MQVLGMWKNRSNSPKPQSRGKTRGLTELESPRSKIELLRELLLACEFHVLVPLVLSVKDVTHTNLMKYYFIKSKGKCVCVCGTSE